MAHVHDAAKAAKTLTEHGMMGGMMAAGMGSGHLPAASGHLGNLAKGAAATGTLVAVSSHNTRQGVVKTLLRNPLVMFGLGLAAGFLIHKYRREIIDTATRVGEQGRDFVLQQRENLEDLVAECKSCEEPPAGE